MAATEKKNVKGHGYRHKTTTKHGHKKTKGHGVGHAAVKHMAAQAHKTKKAVGKAVLTGKVQKAKIEKVRRVGETRVDG